MNDALELRKIAEHFRREAYATTTQLDDAEHELARYARVIANVVLHSASSQPLFRKARNFAKAFNLNSEDEGHCLFLIRQCVLRVVRKSWEAAPKGIGAFPGDKILRAHESMTEGEPLTVARAHESMTEGEQLSLRRRQLKDWANACEWIADESASAEISSPTPSIITTPQATPSVVPSEGDVQRDRAAAGVAFLIVEQQAGRGVTVTRLAKAIGANRTQLYENQEFQGVRETANKLFGLFAKQDVWTGARGTKSKDGDLEAWDA